MTEHERKDCPRCKGTGKLEQPARFADQFDSRGLRIVVRDPIHGYPCPCTYSIKEHRHD